MTKMSNKAVIFDIDGTLLDTVGAVTECMNKMLVNRGFDRVTVERISSLLGGCAREIVAQAIGKEIDEALLTECLDEYTSYYINVDVDLMKPFDGIKEAIAILSERGYKIAALSNKPEYEVEPIRKTILEPLGITLSYGERKGIRPKPDPQGAYLLIEEMGVSAENTYFVGDGESDVLTAINAGMNGIAVLWGNRSREILAEYGATVFAERPQDLLELIK